jgi:hypothetical protein
MVFAGTPPKNPEKFGSKSKIGMVLIFISSYTIIFYFILDILSFLFILRMELRRDLGWKRFFGSFGRRYLIVIGRSFTVS